MSTIKNLYDKNLSFVVISLSYITHKGSFIDVGTGGTGARGSPLLKNSGRVPQSKLTVLPYFTNRITKFCLHILSCYMR